MAHPASVDFEALQQTAPAAIQLLALCAFLAPDDIPLELLRGGQRHVPQPLAATVALPFALTKALAALRRYARVERVDNALWVPHRLSALVYDWLDEAERAVWATVAVTLVNEAVPAESTVVESWPIYTRLLRELFLHRLVDSVYRVRGGAALVRTAPNKAADDKSLEGYWTYASPFVTALECHQTCSQSLLYLPLQLRLRNPLAPERRRTSNGLCVNLSQLLIIVKAYKFHGGRDESGIDRNGCKDNCDYAHESNSECSHGMLLLFNQ